MWRSKEISIKDANGYIVLLPDRGTKWKPTCRCMECWKDFIRVMEYTREEL